MNDRRRGSREPQERYPLVSEDAERAVIGACLHDSSVFWSLHGRLRPEHFSIPRLARIWMAMSKCAENGNPPSQRYIPVWISGDSQEDTPIKVFLTILFNDAPPASEGEIFAETVLHLAHKRALVESLRKAEAEIMSIDVGTPAEHLKDVAIRKVSGAFADDRDDDMMDYYQWGGKVLQRAQAALAAGEGGHYGLSPGLAKVEETIGRGLPGKLYIVAGMSQSGKSALMRQIMEAMAIDGARRGLGRGYIASLEMTGHEYAQRHLSEKIGIPSNDIEHGDFNQGTVRLIEEQVKKMASIPLVVDARPRLTSELIRARAMKIKNQGGLSVMAIDHLLLIRSPSRNASISDRVAEATIEAKNMAKEFGVPVFMLAQLDEKSLLDHPERWPNTTQIFGGQTITQNADVVMFIHRPEVIWAKREPERTEPKKDKDGNIKSTQWDIWNGKIEKYRGKGFVYTNKRRGAKPDERRELLFHGPTMTFSDP